MSRPELPIEIGKFADNFNQICAAAFNRSEAPAANLSRKFAPPIHVTAQLTTQLPKTIQLPKPKRKGRRQNAFRLDLRRALLALGVVAGALVLIFYFATERRQADAERQAAKGFGRESRVGSILVMPLVGDSCRQIAFNNDNGSFIEGSPVSCAEILARSDTNPKKSSHIGAVSETFRK